MARYSLPCSSVTTRHVEAVRNLRGDGHKTRETVVFITERGQVLKADAMDAHNTFDDPEAIAPRVYSTSADGGERLLGIPAKAVVVVIVD